MANIITHPVLTPVISSHRHPVEMKSDFQKLKALIQIALHASMGRDSRPYLESVYAFEHSLCNKPPSNNKYLDMVYLCLPLLKARMIQKNRRYFHDDNLKLLVWIMADRERVAFLDLVRLHGFTIPESKEWRHEMFEEKKYTKEAINEVEEGDVEGSKVVIEDFIGHCILGALGWYNYGVNEQLKEIYNGFHRELAPTKDPCYSALALLFPSDDADIAASNDVVEKEVKVMSMREHMEKNFLELKDRVLLVSRPDYFKLLFCCEYALKHDFKILDYSAPSPTSLRMYGDGHVKYLAFPYLRGKMMLIVAQWKELYWGCHRLMFLNESEWEMQRYLSMFPQWHSSNSNLQELIESTSESIERINNPEADRETSITFLKHCYYRALLDFELIRSLKTEILENLEYDDRPT